MTALPELTDVHVANCERASAAILRDTDLPLAKHRIARSYAHDRFAFTQGLLFADEHLFESTGWWGQSSIRKVRLEDGAVLAKRALPKNVFGEGLVRWGDEIISLTWRDRRGFRWSLADLSPLGEFSYPREAWGLTQNGEHLIVSDGSPVLRFLDPGTMEVKGRLPVTAAGLPVQHLNDLEWVSGEIWANVFYTDLIARIDAATGVVRSWINLSGLRRSVGAHHFEWMLNGLAFDDRSKGLFVTGKNWPKLFEVRVGALPASRGVGASNTLVTVEIPTLMDQPAVPM